MTLPVLQMTISIDSLPDMGVTTFAVPESLDMHGAGLVLPGAPSVEDLRAIRAAGWSRLGIVAAIIDDEQRFLMLEHRPSDKVAAGALGPLAETTHLTTDEHDIRIESASETLARGIRKELGIADPSILALSTRSQDAWITGSWPVGGIYERQQALAICPVLHIGDVGLKTLVERFTPTDEITAIHMMTATEITNSPHVRPGTKAWLGRIARSGLLATPSAERRPLAIPLSQVQSGRDVRFDKITL